MEKKIEVLEKWVRNSECYRNSSSFVNALDYIKRNNIDFYVKLLELEVNEAFGTEWQDELED